MAKRNFDAFYYGVGMKLDKQSIDEVGQQLEGKLNKAVDGVKNNLKSISDAVEKGTKNIDTKGLVSALVEAQRELGHFDDFDPKKLQNQVASLESDFMVLKTTLGDVADSIRGFKDLGGFISDVGARLKSIEIVAPKMGKDALKRDVKEITSIADLASRALANGLTVPDDVMHSLDRKLAKLRQGFRSIEESGNSMTLFTDGGLAKDLVQLVDTLSSIGKPVEGVLDGVIELTSKMKDSFRSNGVTEFTENTSYQVEEFSSSLRKSYRELEEYEKKLESLPKAAKGLAVLKGSDDDKLLTQFDKADNAEQALNSIIAKIKEYRNEVKHLTGEEQVAMYRDMVALAQATEKKIRDSKSQALNEKWSSSFSRDAEFGNIEIDAKAINGEKLGTLLVAKYNDALEDVRKTIKDQIEEIKTDISYYQEEIDVLLVDASKKTKTNNPGRPQGSTNKTKTEKKTTDITQTTGEKFTVSPEIKIDTKKWTKQINDALVNISSPETGKLKPIDLRINTQSRKITEDLNTIRNAIETTLSGTRNSRKKDEQGNPVSVYMSAFDKSFTDFEHKLTKAKTDILKIIKDEWQPELKEAFKFKMTIDGMEKTNAKNQITSFVSSYINSLNDTLPMFPIKLHSNIDTLIEEIKQKVQDIKIEGGEVNLRVGGIEFPTQNLGNISVGVNARDVAQDNVGKKTTTQEGTERKILDIVERKVDAEKKGAEAVEQKVKTENKSDTSTSNPSKNNDTPKVETSIKKSDGEFDKQQIYNEVHHSIKNQLATFNDVDSALAWVKTQAETYGTSLRNNQEGTEEYFKAQAGLTTLLHQWRAKISSTKKDSPWRNEKWVGFKGGGLNWSKYLKEVGIQGLLPDGFALSKETTFREEQGLTEPKISRKKSTTVKSQKIEESAEEMIARDFEHTKEIAQHILKLAKWAKALGSIADGIDYTITETDFENKDSITRNGVTYTKQDLDANGGKIISRGNRLTADVLNEFVAEYENSEDEEFKQLFEFVKKLIDVQRLSQQRLDETLKSLAGTDVATKYGETDNKTEYLATGIKSSFRRLMGKGANKDAQDSVVAVLSKYGVLDSFEGLSSQTKPEEIFKSIQGNILESKNIDSIIAELSALDGNVGKTYKNFINLLRIAKEFMLTSNSIQTIGQEARNWIGGTKEQRDKYKKEIDPRTGRSITTDEKIGVENKLIENGLRQFIKEFKAIFIDEFGNRLGFNEGKNIVDDFVPGSASFTKIIDFLEKALSVAVDIQTPKNKGVTKDYTNIRTHGHIGDMSNETPKYTTTVKKNTEVDEIAGKIQLLQSQKKNIEENLVHLRSEIQNAVSSTENVDKILEISEKKDEKKQEIDLQKKKIEKIQDNISALESQISNPKRTLEELTDDLLQKEAALQQLQNQYDGTPEPDTEIRNEIKQQIEQGKKAIDSLKKEIENPQLFEDIHKTILKKKEDIEEIENQIGKIGQENISLQSRYSLVTNTPKHNEMIQKRQEVYQIKGRAFTKLKDSSQLKREIAQIEKTANESQGGVLTDEQKRIIEGKRQQADQLLKEYDALIKQQNEIESTLIPYEESIRVLEQSIEENKKVYQQLVEQKNAIKKQVQSLSQTTYDAQRGSDEHIFATIGEEEAKIKLLEDELNGKNTADMEAKKARLEDMQHNLQQLNESLRTAQSQKDNNAINKITQQIIELEAEIKPLEDENSLHIREVAFLHNVIKAKKDYVDALRRGMSLHKTVSDPNEVKAKLDSQVQELTQLQTGLAKSQAELSTLEESEANIINKEIETLLAQKNEKEARIKEIDTIANSSDSAALESERNKLESEIAQIDKHINEGIVKIAIRIRTEIEKLEEQLASKIKTLEEQEKKLQTANKTDYSYTDSTGAIVTKERATELLGSAKSELEQEKNQYLTMAAEYAEQSNALSNKPLEMVMAGTMTSEEAQKILKAMIGISDISKQLKQGEISRAEYVDKITNSYIAMQTILGNVNHEMARAEADKLADSVQNIARLEQQISLLEEIEKTETPAVEPKTIAESKETITEENKQSELESQQTAEEEKQLQIAQQRTAEETKRTQVVVGSAVSHNDVPPLSGIQYNIGLAESNLATVEKQKEIIDILKAGIKVNGKATDDKDGEEKEPTAKKSKKKTPKIPTVGKVDLQSETINGLTDVNKEWDVYKNYIAAKTQLSRELESAKVKGDAFTPEDADRIRATRDQVLSLGKDVIKTSEAFTDLKTRSQDATNGIKIGVADVKEDMLSMVHDRAIAEKALISDISFDDEKQRMTAVLTDMEGQAIRLSMRYYDTFDAIITSSDKTTDSVRNIYKAVESEMQKMVEAGNLTNEVTGKPSLKKTKEFDAYSDAYKQMLESANKVREKGALATQDEKNELISLRKQVETTRIAFEKMAKASADFDAKVGENVVGINNSQSLEEQMKNYVLNSQNWTNHQRQMIEESWKFSEAQNSAAYSVEKNKGQLASMSVVADMGTKRIGQFTQETKQYKSGMEKFMDSLKNKWQEVARYLMTFGSMYRVFAVLKQGLTYVKEIDSALTELKKVTDETEESYERFLNTAAKTADKVGSTIKEIVSSTADWARIGYSLEDAATLAESTAILLNVSEFRSIDEATSALTSTLQAFSYTAEQSMHVVDVLNEVGNNFAVSSDGIATALKDSASSLVAANNTYEEAVALVASANKVVQDPGSVGAALRTISLRLRSTSTEELEEVGEDTTGAITSKSKLQGKVKGLTGVDILTDTGAYRSTYDILLDISKVWKNISDVDQAALLEIIAGKTRSNTAAAILLNTKDLEEALVAAQDAEGSALRENEKYLDSIQGKIDQFNNAVQTMWSDTLDSDVVKDFVALGTELVKIIDDVGLLKLAIAGLITYVSQKWGGLNFAEMFSSFTSKGVNVLFGKSINQNIQSTTSKLEELERSVQRAKQAYIDNGGSKASAKTLKEAEETLATYKKLQEEGFKPSDKTKGYFGTEIQKIKDYKKELADLDVAIPQAEKALQDAQNELGAMWSQGEFGDVDVEEIDKYSQKVKEAQRNVDALKTKKAELKKTGSGAFQSLADGANKLSKQIQSAITSMLVMYAISKAMQLISDLWDSANETAEEARERFDELNSELSKTKSELSTLETQFNDIKDKIQEINENTPLTFTDQEELSRLQAESSELQRQIDLLKEIEKQQAYGVNESAINAANKYAQTGVTTGKTTSENVGDKAGTGAAIGAGVGVASGVGTALLGAKAGTALGSWAGPVGMLIGAVVGALTGGIIGATVGGIESAAEEKVGDSLDNMKKQYEKLQSEYNTARANYQKDASEDNKEKFEEAQKAFNSYQSNMANYMTEMNSYYSQIKANWDVATKEQKQAYNEWADTMDTWAIQTGGQNAKSNALDRLFGENAEGGFAIARDRVDEIKEKLKDAQETGDELAIANALKELEDFKLEGILSEEEVERLRNIGLYLYEAEDRFKDVVKTESEFINNDLEDVAKDINKIEEGLESLKSAFEEVLEKEVLTAKTLKSLKEELKIESSYSNVKEVQDAWRNYLDTMMSGAATTEEMTKKTEELAQAILDAALAKNDLKPETKHEYVAQLRQLGVANAEEYVDDLLQKNMVQEIERSAEVAEDAVRKAYTESTKNIFGPVKSFDELDDTEIRELAKQYGLLGDISNDVKQDIMERYGVEEDAVDAIIEKLKEKQDLEKQIAAKQKEKSDYEAWRNGDDTNKGILALQEELQQIGNLDDYKAQTRWVEGVRGGGHSETYYQSADGKYLSEDDYNKYKKIKERYDALWAEGEEKGYIIDGKIVNPDFQAEIDGLQNQIDGITKDIDENITIDIDLKLKLQDKSELVDDIQNTFDTLVNAQKEYDENGYITTDTLQTLLQLEPKYLDLLVDEEGKLNLTKDALYNVGRARVADMAIQQKKNILEKANQLAAKGSSDALREHITVMENANATGDDFVANQMKQISVLLDKQIAEGKLNEFEKNEFLNGVQSQLDAVDQSTQIVLDNFENAFSSAGNTAKQETEDAFKKAMEYWENRIGANQSLYEQLQNDIDLLEKKGQIAGESYYQAQIDVENEHLRHLKDQRDEATEFLKGEKRGTERWWEIANTLNDIEGEIDSVTLSIQDLSDAMAQVHWDVFDQAHERMDDLTAQLSNVREILSADEDSFFTDEGEWSDTGIAVLATHIQDIAVAESTLADVEKELKNLKMSDFDSENEYYDKLTELTEKQQDYTMAISDSEQAVVDMYESNIDAVEEYFDKLIENYSDYIDSVKEALDAERDYTLWKQSYSPLYMETYIMYSFELLETP